MTNTHLDFTVTIEADEATLRDLKNQLSGAKRDEIISAIESVLECEGAFICKIAGSRVLLKAATEGGLNAEEWMSQPHASDDSQSAYKHDFQD